MSWKPTSKQQDFAEWLERLSKKKDRGRLAALRSGLTLDPSQLYQLYNVLPPHFFLDLEPRSSQRYLMVAALFGFHPVFFPSEALAKRRRNLGESLRMLAQAKAEEGDDPEELLPDPLRRRMEAILAAHPDELYGHLFQVISLLKTGEIPVDWAQLLADLHGWDHSDHPVQWQWSRAFFVGYREMEGGDGHVS